MTLKATFHLTQRARDANHPAKDNTNAKRKALLPAQTQQLLTKQHPCQLGALCKDTCPMSSLMTEHVICCPASKRSNSWQVKALS